MRTFVAVIVAVLAPRFVVAAEPRVLVDGYELELVANEPDIVTPIGMTFDPHGRLLVIESHTHQRPEDYDGPAGDRIRMFADSDGDGRLDRWSTFAEGFQQSMNLCVRPEGGVYLVTRRDVRLLEDTDGDGKADKTTEILRLETEGEYPHNGLGGIALNGDGRILIGLGENFGLPYRLVGTDESFVGGRGGVGTIFTCTQAGGEVQRLASGFWNPFSICLERGRTFCIDNDPDASPPCRLIHVVPTGDYGHRWEYGRAGVHPLQSWNGELPGTLPMICGTGEAPTAIVAHQGHLWVTSWGDHRVERYELTPSGGTFAAKCDIVAQGDADFRPTGMAVAPDGSLYFGDWVDRSYPVHGKGHIWRLQMPGASGSTITWPPASRYDHAGSQEESDDPFVRQIAVDAFTDTRLEGASWLALTPRGKLGWLQALRFKAAPMDVSQLRMALKDHSPDVRMYALRWIADERIKELRDDVAKLLDGPMPSERYFLCVLAALEWLDGDGTPRDRGISNALLQRELANESRSPELHALALRMISPDHEWLTAERLRGYLAAESPALKLEAVRTLEMQTRPERFAALAAIAEDADYEAALRAEAVAGLAAAVGEYEELLNNLAQSDNAIVAAEAQRVLRLSLKRAAGAGVDPEQHERPEQTDLDAWTALLAEGGDPDSGRRLFFTRPGPLCSQCHQYGGRGGRVGPDLSRIGEQQSRERIIASIVQPSREIAPHYQAWSLVTIDGLVRAGLRLPEGGDDGTEPYADAEGNVFELRSEEIELRSPSAASIMPEGLVDLLTVEDMRDLVAFLTAPTE